MRRAKERISDLQEFVRRFSANASKARQATSRRKAIERSRSRKIRRLAANPYIRFEQAKKLYRNRVRCREAQLHVPRTDTPILNNVSFNVEAGERIASSAERYRKTTMMRLLAGELKPSAGTITWVENAQVGYMPQDPQAEFAEKTDLFNWMSVWTGKSDERADHPRHAGAPAVLR